MRKNLKRALLPIALVLPLLLLVVIPAALFAHEEGAEHSHSSSEAERQVVNPRSDYWRHVREGVEGYTAVRGQEVNVFIQAAGQNWRQLRNGPVAAYGAGLLGIVLVALGGFFLYRGKVELKHPRTGESVTRWTLGERVLHWVTATLFLLLMITGLSLLYGRVALIPLIGHEAFAAYAEWAKAVHNYLGPGFILGLLLMLGLWARANIPNRIDWEWFKAAGGMVGDAHPSAERMNAGEKAWFWLLAGGGILVCASGLLLDFPNFGQERWLLQGSHLVHVVFALVLIAGALGHIYIGTIGTEGALEGMITGRVDKSWAIQHHDLWYEEIARRGAETNAAASPDQSYRDEFAVKRGS